MPHRWMSIVLVALVFALPGHPEGARRIVSDARRAAPPPARLDASGDPLPPGALWRLGSLRLNAGGSVEFLAFTPDGKNLISAGSGSALHIWDTATGRRRDVPALANVHPALPTPHHRIGISVTGHSVFVYDSGGTAHLLDARGMRMVRRWPLDLVGATCHAVAPDGSLLAWGSRQGGIVNLVEPLGNGPPRVWKIGGNWELRRMAFSPDSKYFAVIDETNKSVLLYLVEGGKRLRRYDVDLDQDAFVGFGAGGQSLVIGTRDGAGVYPLDSSEPKYDLEHPGVAPIGFTWVVHGKMLATRHANGVVHVWDITTGKSIREVKLGRPETEVFAVSPDGLRVATASRAGQIQLWDTRTGKPTLPAEVSKPILAAGFDASGGEIVVGHPGLVRRAATRTGEPGGTFEVALENPFPGRIVLSPAGDRIAEVGDAVSIIDTKTGKKRGPFEFGRRNSGGEFLFLTDGRHALMAPNSPRKMIVLDLETGRQRNLLPPGGAWANLRLGADGRTMYNSPNQSFVERWEVATGRRRSTLDIAGMLLDVSPDGRRLAVGVGADAHIVEIDSGRYTVLPNAIAGNWTVSFSPGGEWIACFGDPMRGITIWNLRTGRLAARVHGHRGALRTLAFSPNGKEFLSASDDGTLVVWDLAEVLRKGRVEPAVIPPVRPMEALWADLASDDAALADRAIREMVRSPGVAERFLARHLRPVAAIPPAVLDGLLADLNGDRATLRDDAEGKLAAIGEQAVSALRTAEKAGSPEVRRRAKRLLARIEVFARTGVEAQHTRALEALELLGTDAAKKLLGELARGADATPTREAKASLARLRVRVSSEP